MSMARSALRHDLRLVMREAPVVAVMRELAAQLSAYSCRRIRVFPSRWEHAMSAD